MANELSNLKPVPGERRPKFRVGRGKGSGNGKTAGKGTKGAQARSGYGYRPGFEGGQMPMHRRLPKVGFKNPFSSDYAEVNVGRLSVFDAGLERILATHPDLILADAGTPFSIDQLRRVAPTVVMRVASAEQRLLDVGTVLGLRDRAEARLAEHAEKMQRARALLAPFAATETVALLRVHQKQFRLYGDRLGCAPVLFDVLGLRPSPLVQRRVIEPGLSQSPLSEESLALLDADRVFLYVDPPAQARTHLLLARNPVWRTLPAVRAGRVHRLTSAIIWNSVLARERMVDDVLEAYGQERICCT